MTTSGYGYSGKDASQTYASGYDPPAICVFDVLMNVREINAVQQLHAHRDSWRSLLEVTPAASFFQSLEWLEVYWKHFGDNQRLRVLVISQRGEISGILPLVVRQDSTRIGTVRFLTYPLDYWGSFYGPVGANSQETLAIGLDYLRSIKPDWDAIELRWIGARDEETSESGRAMRVAGLSPVCDQVDSTSIVDMQGSWEEYLAGKTSKWRSKARRWQKKIAQQGALRYERYRPTGGDDDEPRWDLLEDCLQVARASWQGSSQTGTTLSHAAILPFVRDMHAAAARAGGLDVNLLYLNERPIAFCYNYCHHGNVFGLRAGFDASLSRDGAGNLLYVRTLEDSFRRQDWRYDLGPGSLECKRLWRTHVLPIHRISHFRRLSLRPQLLRLKRVIDGRNVSFESGGHVVDGNLV